MPVLLICKNEANLKTRAGNSLQHYLILLTMELDRDFLPLLVTYKIEADLKTRNVTVYNKYPLRALILTFDPLSKAMEPQTCTGHKLSFCFTFVCDFDLGRRTLILIMTYHLIIFYLFIKSISLASVVFLEM